ncbi:hypothetical protein FB567DRAFT_209779 [Paraphoma chrysanthemicola]|uniref:CHRD domain-containing protein n=1 Tax=Paraphoma chrysanthemicola TaxID=798071 RepID=A0A8K0QWK7_9PLEO|nr:hypothetical protein FB567DRAFT_209779 [Paraphoma chrysanthemicola]
MHFSAPALLALLTASVAVAAPTNGGDKYKKDCDQDWEKKWKNDDWKKSEKLFYFSSSYYVKATPDQVVNATSGLLVPGQPGAQGIFKYGINVEENTICYNITLSGVTGEYRSPAITATHIHEGPKGKAGPPRLAFPNPKGPDHRRVSYGCLTGPFFVGTNNTAGVDNAAGFHVRQIVANASNFFTDSHTVQYSQGAVRGQLA